MGKDLPLPYMYIIARQIVNDLTSTTTTSHMRWYIKSRIDIERNV